MPNKADKCFITLMTHWAWFCIKISFVFFPSHLFKTLLLEYPLSSGSQLIISLLTSGKEQIPPIGSRNCTLSCLCCGPTLSITSKEHIKCLSSWSGPIFCYVLDLISSATQGCYGSHSPFSWMAKFSLYMKSLPSTHTTFHPYFFFSC